MENSNQAAPAAPALTSSSALMPATITLHRVLVVESDASASHAISTALTKWHINEIVIATDAAQALRVMREPKPFDVLICAGELSSGNGVELVETLRAQGDRTPILMLSSQSSLEFFGAALMAGTDDILHTPVDLKELRSAISALVARFSERERCGSAFAPLHGADVRIEIKDGVSTLILSAATPSIQLESFQRVCERIAANHLPPAERMYLHLALEEILQNAREWGNCFDASKRVTFAFTPKSDRVTFSIEDEGAGFNPAEVPDPSIDPKAHIKRRLASGKRIGGWGLFIARKRMDDVSFNPKGNAVSITKLFQQ